MDCPHRAASAPISTSRGHVMLIEQMRPGLLRRGAGNPWSLEPVAGIVDAGETPEQAARRETAEEAGLELAELRQMFGIYPSPGSTTDHFYCYLGIADLPKTTASLGGLAHEGEDLRRHVLPLAEALELIETGEGNAGPLVAMLLWCEVQRARGALG